MVHDPIGDMIIQLKNAVLAKKHTVELPYSRIKHVVASVLVKEGYLQGAQIVGDSPKQRLHLTIAYEDNKKAVLGDVKRVSKPGLRMYVGAKEIPQVVGGMGIALVSTPQGIMTGAEAKKKGIGGELLCLVW